MTTTAASSDNGMAASEMAAVRRLNRNKPSTITTSAPPINSEFRTLPVAVAMKLAGRNRSACKVTCCPASPDSRPESACSMRRVTSKVLAWYCSEITSCTLGLPLMDAAPIGGSGAATTCATSPSVTLPPATCLNTVAASCSAVSDWPSLCRVRRWLAVSMKPAPRTPVALRAAVSTSSIDTSNLTSFSGRTCT